MSPSRTQLKNLETLATFLEQNYSSLNFNMRGFMIVDRRQIVFPPSPDDIKNNNCYTVACAVGHGPLAGITAKSHENWFDYASRAFFGETKFYDSVNINRNWYWTWLFSDIWTKYDNTALGAAARIRYFLDHQNNIAQYFDSFDRDLYEEYLVETTE